MADNDNDDDDDDARGGMREKGRRAGICEVAIAGVDENDRRKRKEKKSPLTSIMATST